MIKKSEKGICCNVGIDFKFFNISKLSEGAVILNNNNPREKV
jgi:hypothetical protein